MSPEVHGELWRTLLKWLNCNKDSLNMSREREDEGELKGKKTEN